MYIIHMREDKSLRGNAKRITSFILKESYEENIILFNGFISYF